MKISIENLIRYGIKNLRIDIKSYLKMFICHNVLSHFCGDFKKMDMSANIINNIRNVNSSMS